MCGPSNFTQCISWCQQASYLNIKHFLSTTGNGTEIFPSNDLYLYKLLAFSLLLPSTSTRYFLFYVLQSFPNLRHFKIFPSLSFPHVLLLSVSPHPSFLSYIFPPIILVRFIFLRLPLPPLSLNRKELMFIKQLHEHLPIRMLQRVSASISDHLSGSISCIITSFIRVKLVHL
jgi:hypothetical protein